MAPLRHPNKHIRASIALAESAGWWVRPGAHGFLRIGCPCGHPGCQMSVWSTPKNPEHHARHIERFVGRCPGCGDHRLPGSPGR